MNYIPPSKHIWSVALIIPCMFEKSWNKSPMATIQLCKRLVGPSAAFEAQLLLRAKLFDQSQTVCKLLILKTLIYKSLAFSLIFVAFHKYT